MSIRISKKASLSLRKKCEAFLESLQASGYRIPEGGRQKIRKPEPTSPSSSSSSNSIPPRPPKATALKGQRGSVLYEWPGTKEKNTVIPAFILRRPSDGSLFSVYDKVDCPDYFIVPTHGPAPGVPTVDSNPEIMEEICGVMRVHFKRRNANLSSEPSGSRAPPPTPTEELSSQPTSSTEDSGTSPSSSSKDEVFSPVSTSEDSAQDQEGLASAAESKINDEKISSRTDKKEEEHSATGTEKTSNPTKVLKYRGCSFCRSNGESQEVVNSHILMTRERDVICPFLSKYICPICNATGKKAHTIKYCPKRSKKERFEYMVNYPRLVRTSIGKLAYSRY